MEYVFQEYPKMLVVDGEEVIVNSQEEEDTAMAVRSTEESAVPAKRGRKPKEAVI